MQAGKKVPPRPSNTSAPRSPSKGAPRPAVHSGVAPRPAVANASDPPAPLPVVDPPRSSAIQARHSVAAPRTSASASTVPPAKYGPKKPLAPKSSHASHAPTKPLSIPRAPQVPERLSVVDEAELEDVPAPASRRPLGSERVRGTLVSPEEVIAYVLESCPPPTPPRVTISDPLDVVFGMVHELSFAEDAIDAAAFAARTVAAFLPCRAVLFHLFDPKKNELALAHVFGAPKATALVGHRVAQALDPIFAIALEEGRTKDFHEAPEAKGVLAERHRIAGASSRVLAHPILGGGEPLAFIEAVDPRDDVDERITSALMYLSTHVAAFLLAHERILPVPIPDESGTICYHCMDGLEHECRVRG